MTDDDFIQLRQAVEAFGAQVIRQGEWIATLAEQLNEAVGILHKLAGPKTLDRAALDAKLAKWEEDHRD